jgi:hypothetical protein
VAGVVRKLYELALDGDVAAARCWLDHAIGRPMQAVELSAPVDQGLDAMTVLRVVMDTLAPLPNFTEIRIKLGEAFRRLETTRDGLVRPEPSG